MRLLRSRAETWPWTEAKTMLFRSLTRKKHFLESFFFLREINQLKFSNEFKQTYSIFSDFQSES